MQSNTPKAQLKQMDILFLAMFAGLILFGGVGYVINLTSPFGMEDMSQTLLIVTFVLAAGGIFGGDFLFKQQMRSIAFEKTVDAKINDYRSALIIRLALIEGPALMAAIGFLLTGGNLFILFLVAMLIYFWFQRPTKEKISKDLSLTAEEKEQI